MIFQKGGQFGLPIVLPIGGVACRMSTLAMDTKGLHVLYELGLPGRWQSSI